MPIRRPSSTPPHRPFRLKPAMALGLMAALSLAACQGEAPPTAKMPERVLSQVVRYEPVVRTVTLTGTIMARVESDLSFRTAGQIADRRVDVGDHVEAGQVLATLETEEQQADLESAKATVVAAEATLVQAQTNFDRQKQLLDGGYTTRSSFENAEESLRTAQSSLDSAKADVGTAEDALSYTELKSDADGVITARNAETGQVVDAAQTVFTLARDGERDGVFDIYESLLASGSPPERIEVHLVSDPAVKAVGTIREVAPTFDTSTGTVRVKISLQDPPAALSLGAAVTGVAQMNTKDAVTLPWTALSSTDGKPSVWIVDPQSKAVSQRPIVIDRYRTGEILVREGLKDGDIVVTAGAQLLSDGQIVALASGDAK